MDDTDPVCSPNGRELVFASNRKDTFQIYRKVLVAGEEEPLLASSEDRFPKDWSKDGRSIVSSRKAARTSITCRTPASENQAHCFILNLRKMRRKDGKELFYLTLDGKLMAVEVKGGAAVETGPPKALFQTPPLPFLLGHAETTLSRRFADKASDVQVELPLTELRVPEEG